MIILVFFICLAAGTIGGICGIGGGVVIKPLLDAIGIMPVSAVSFLSGLTVLAMSCINVCKNRNSTELDTARSVPLGIGAALGGVAGKYMFSALKTALGNDRAVGGVQAIVLGLFVLGTLLYVLNKNRIATKNVEGRLVPGLIGLCLGICSSFLGIGGGPMNLAVLCYFFSMGTKQAAVNSLLIILFSQATSLIMTLATRTVPAFEWGALVAMVGAGVLSGFISAWLHKKLSEELTDKLFIGLLTVIFGICVYNAVRMLI